MFNISIILNRNALPVCTLSQRFKKKLQYAKPEHAERKLLNTILIMIIQLFCLACVRKGG